MNRLEQFYAVVIKTRVHEAEITIVMTCDPINFKRCTALVRGSKHPQPSSKAYFAVQSLFADP